MLYGTIKDYIPIVPTQNQKGVSGKLSQPPQPCVHWCLPQVEGSGMGFGLVFCSCTTYYTDYMRLADQARNPKLPTCVLQQLCGMGPACPEAQKPEISGY